MSTPFRRNQSDPLSIVPFDQELLANTVYLARESPRRRYITRFHELHEPFQRMLNAIEPESYARPHQHLDPAKTEVFVALRGSALVVRFADDGTPVEGTIVSPDGPVRGVEIPPGAWHCLVSLESGTVLFEAKEGPYDEATDKRFAPWSPPENDHDAAVSYIASLRAHFATILPELGARNTIEAEDDEIL